MVSVFDDACCTSGATIGPPIGPTTRAGAEAQQRRPHGHAGSPTAAARSSTPRSSEAPSCCPTATSRSAGAHSRCSPSSRRPARCCSTWPGPTPTSTTACTSRSGPASPSGRPTASCASRQHDHRVSRAGTAPRRWRRWRVLGGKDAKHLASVATQDQERLRDGDPAGNAVVQGLQGPGARQQGPRAAHERASSRRAARGPRSCRRATEIDASGRPGVARLSGGDRCAAC